MNPLFEGPLGPQRMEHLNIREFPSYQRWLQQFSEKFQFPLIDDRVIEGECVETPDPREDLIHPFID